MKTVHFAGIFLFVMFAAVACSKENNSNYPQAIPAFESDHFEVAGASLVINLLRVEGFRDPCFRIGINNSPAGDFRFTGGMYSWNYKTLSPGYYAFTYSCLHNCTDDHANALMVFQLNEGALSRNITASRIDHCSYQFKLKVN